MDRRAAGHVLRLIKPVYNGAMANRIAGDALIACAAVALVLVLGLAGHTGPGEVAAAVAVASPLVLRRRFPLTTAVLAGAVVLVTALPDWPGRLVAMAAFGSAAYHRPRPVVLVVSVGWLVLLGVAGVRPTGVTATYADLILLGVAPVATGYALRLHRDRAERAARLHQEQTHRVVAEEHARVAREVHDAVGHHLTLIRLQANAVRHAAALPPVAERALTTIGESSATALAEVREVLAALPARGTALSELDAVVEAANGPDRTVTLATDGPDYLPLPPLVDHGAFRLAQEALTNALRHSGASRVEVRVRRLPDALVITVTDNGPTTPGGQEEGAGLRGMRERARLLGGDVRIGPNQPSGWLVEARLPLVTTR